MMPDLGKDAPVCVNESGGKQSALDVSLVRVPPHALIAVGKVLASGAKKYPDDADGTPNWHRIDVRDHLNHMLTHAMAYLAGDTQDDHLEHMACRALMALERKYLDEKKKKNDDFWEEEGRRFMAGLKPDANGLVYPPNGPEKASAVLGGLAGVLPDGEDEKEAKNSLELQKDRNWEREFRLWLSRLPTFEKNIDELRDWFHAGVFGDESDGKGASGINASAFGAGRTWSAKFDTNSNWWLRPFNEWLDKNREAKDECLVDDLQKYFRSGVYGILASEWTPPLTSYRLAAHRAGRTCGIANSIIDPSA